MLVKQPLNVASLSSLALLRMAWPIKQPFFLSLQNLANLPKMLYLEIFKCLDYIHVQFLETRETSATASLRELTPPCRELRTSHEARIRLTSS